MKIGIGIDTGGTCTDAVLYDFDSSTVLDSAKALTTKEDLSIGMCEALGKLDKSYFKDVQLVSLSTTLATNACVENKGSRAKLVMMNIDKKTVDWVGKKYGLSDNGELYFIDIKEDDNKNAQYEKLKVDMKDWLSDADGLGIVEIDAFKNGAVFEKEGRDILKNDNEMPIICGYELFDELNSLKRSSSTLLNVRLIPIINNFIEKIKYSIKEMGINSEIAIVRSDCSLMSEEFSRTRPVETILCGPAASVVGGMKLTDEENCILIDMGGTTTDLSIVKDGRAVRVSGGVSIGKWRTFVDGVFIDTFGLGGDSRVFLNRGELQLDSRRVMPICVAANKYPQVEKQLDDLLSTNRHHNSIGLNEFFVLLKDITNSTKYTEEEKLICKTLKDGPIILESLAIQTGTDIYRFNTTRLEDEGIIIRCGLTPTDIMHIKGDFNFYNTNAAKKAAMFIVRSLKKDEEDDSEVLDFCDTVYDLVKRKLYFNLVRVLLEQRYEKFAKDGIDKQVESMIYSQWEEEKKGKGGFINHSFTTDLALVSIGAPTYIFLPDVAKALHTKCVVPENAGVSNAVGAIVSKIEIRQTVKIRPINSPEGIIGYNVYCKNGTVARGDYNEAVKVAIADAKEKVLQEAKVRKIENLSEIEIYSDKKGGKSAQNVEVFLGSEVTAVAYSKLL